MKYFEITFKCEPACEAFNDVLSAELATVGFETFVTDVDLSLKAYIQQTNYDEDAIKSTITNFPLPNVLIEWQLEEAENENWNETWENEGFQPIIVDNRLVVCDPRHVVDKSLEHILIHPRQAFGTGSHQTTRMLLSTLLKLDLNGSKVIDAGCGTGILGLFCLKHGASRLLAYDVDEWSVQNTLDNSELNHINQNKLDVRLGDSSVIKDIQSLHNDEKYDLLIANINRNILLADMPNFAKCLKNKGHILLSGFYQEDIPILQSVAETLGYNVTLTRNDEEWAMIMLEGRGV